MKISKLMQIFTLIWMYGICMCALCPNDATIMTDDSRFWCVWLVDQKLTIKGMIDQCALSDGFVFGTPNKVVQTFFDNALVPVLQASRVKTLWMNYNDSSATTFEGKPTNYTYWKDIVYFGEPCVIASAVDRYRWDVSSCYNIYNGLCYRELDCNPHGVYFLSSDLCFWPTYTRDTQVHGQRRCTSRNATLAVFPTAYEWDFVVNNPIIKDANDNFGGGFGFWLGINDTIEEGNYRQINGEDVPYLKWNTEEHGSTQDKDCVLMRVANSSSTWNGSMVDDQCQNYRLSLCMKGEVSVEPYQPSSNLSTPNGGNAQGELSVGKSALGTATETSKECGYMMCTCPAELYNAQFRNDSEAFEQHLEQLKKETVIDAKNTSAYKNSLVCATDDRASSQAVGQVAAILIMSLFGLIVLGDVMTVGRSLFSSAKTKT